MSSECKDDEQMPTSSPSPRSQAVTSPYLLDTIQGLLTFLESLPLEVGCTTAGKTSESSLESKATSVEAAFPRWFSMTSKMHQKLQMEWKYGLNYSFEALKQYRDWYLKNHQYHQLTKDKKNLEDHVNQLREKIEHFICSSETQIQNRFAKKSKCSHGGRVFKEISRIVQACSSTKLRMRISQEDLNLIISSDFFQIHVIVDDKDEITKATIEQKSGPNDEPRMNAEKSQRLYEILVELGRGDKRPFQKAMEILVHHADLARRYPEVNFCELEDKMHKTLQEVIPVHQADRLSRSVAGVTVLLPGMCSDDQGSQLQFCFCEWKNDIAYAVMLANPIRMTVSDARRMARVVETGNGFVDEESVGTASSADETFIAWTRILESPGHVLLSRVVTPSPLENRSCVVSTHLGDQKQLTMRSHFIVEGSGIFGDATVLSFPIALPSLSKKVMESVLGTLKRYHKFQLLVRSILSTKEVLMASLNAPQPYLISYLVELKAPGCILIKSLDRVKESDSAPLISLEIRIDSSGETISLKGSIHDESLDGGVLQVDSMVQSTFEVCGSIPLVLHSMNQKVSMLNENILQQRLSTAKSNIARTLALKPNERFT